jgi:quercetin dioxygenase-like cupin family protein
MMKNNETNSKVAIETAPPPRRDRGTSVESRPTEKRTQSSLAEQSRSARDGHVTAAPVGRESDDCQLASNEIDSRTRFGPGGGIYRIVTTAAESHGRHFVFVATEPPGGGTRLHTHAAEDEYFLVLQGEILFYINGRVRVAKRGESAFVPRGVPHCFKNCSDREAQMLVSFTPGNIEGFFDYGLSQNGERPSEEHLLKRIRELGPKYGLEVLGPSPL